MQEVAAWHLRTALRAEPADARMALALADVLSLESSGDRALEGAAVVAQAVEALVAAADAGALGGPPPSAADNVAIAAGLRRLGGHLVKHGERDQGSVALKVAFRLDQSQ